METLEAARLAVEFAAASPCAKSQRGAVIFNRVDGGYYGACNAPPRPFICDGSDACRAACNKVAVHAEEAALLKAGYRAPRAGGWEMLHAKTVDGVLVPSGGPSCWQCSRTILAAGIARVWLYHDAGWTSYDTEDFHALTLAACGLPDVREVTRG